MNQLFSIANTILRLLFAIMFSINSGCKVPCDSNQVKSVVIISMPGSKMEREFHYNEKSIMPQKTGIDEYKLPKKFCKTIDSLRLGAVYNKILFIDDCSDTILEANTFSVVSSFLDKNAKGPYIIFINKENTYFPNCEFRIHDDYFNVE